MSLSLNFSVSGSSDFSLIPSKVSLFLSIAFSIMLAPKEPRQAKNPAQRAKSRSVVSARPGSILSFSTLPNKESVEFMPKAIESSFVANQPITITLFAMSKFSPPQPKTPRPNNAIGNDPMLTPKAKTAWPMQTNAEDKKMIVLAPNLSIKSPPTNGNMIFGKEYIEYNMLNWNELRFNA